MNSPSIIISRRQKTDGPNHNLWNNNGTWWLHFTRHFANGTAQRVRLSLKTTDLNAARALRERIFFRAGNC